MAGTIDYAALPTVVEVVGARDPERLINQLVIIRDHMRNKGSD